MQSLHNQQLQRKEEVEGKKTIAHWNHNTCNGDGSVTSGVHVLHMSSSVDGTILSQSVASVFGVPLIVFV